MYQVLYDVEGHGKCVELALVGDLTYLAAISGSACHSYSGLHRLRNDKVDRGHQFWEYFDHHTANTGSSSAWPFEPSGGGWR